MNSSDQDTLAMGRVGIAVQRLAEDYPFHASILSKFKIISKPDIATMGVGMQAERLVLYIGPDFVLDQPPDALRGMLLHEVHHVLFKHIQSDPDDFPDRWARQVAEEVTANEFITEPLPPGGILLSQFPELPPMESTYTRYERLAKHTDRFDLEEPGVASGDETLEEPEDASGKGTIDDHSMWMEANFDREAAKIATQSVISDAVSEIGLENVPAELLPTVGSQASANTESLHADRDGQLPWQVILRRHVGRIRRPRPVFGRPPRRFPHLVGILPGRQYQAARPTIMAVIDTSGSLTQTLLEEIVTELGLLARNNHVTVVECDCEIHAVYRYRPIEEVSGRGGTDFRPPFEPKFLQKHKPDLVIYFTDGEGPAPEQPPRVPVIWCLVGDGKCPATWGKTIRLGRETSLP
jgi:predicted metal-dependent peptidase